MAPTTTRPWTSGRAPQRVELIKLTTIDISNGARLKLPRISPAWCLVLPIVLLIGGLYVLPLLSVLELSLTDPKPGLGNYEKILTSQATARVLATTLRVCAATTVITIVLGFIVALALTRLKGLHQRLLIVGIIIPLWISVIVRGLSWLVILRDNGLVNSWLVSSGLIDTP